MDKGIAKEMLLELAWELGWDEFGFGQYKYRFIPAINKRATDHLVVMYPEGGVRAVEEKWPSRGNCLYKVGHSFMAKDQILSQFGLRSNREAKGFSYNPGKSLLTYKTTEERVTDTLRDLQKSSGSKEILVSRAQLGAMSQCSTASVSGAVKKLVAAGVIASKGTLSGLVITFLKEA